MVKTKFESSNLKIRKISGLVFQYKVKGNMDALQAVALPGGNEELKADGSGVGARDDGILIQPRPGFVIKTKREILVPSTSSSSSSTSLSRQKLFINVVSHDAIAVPTVKKRLDAEGKEIEGMNVPVSVGPFRQCRDKAGKQALAIDCIVNPSVLKKDASITAFGGHRDFLCQFVMQCIEQKSCSGNRTGSSNRGFGVSNANTSTLIRIDRKYTLPRLSYQGWVDSITGENVDRESDNAAVAKQMIRDISKRPTIQEVDSSESKIEEQASPNIKKSLTEAAVKTRMQKPADLPAPPKPIPIDIRVETSEGNVLPLFDFLEEINAGRGHDRPKVRPTLLPVSPDDGCLLFSSQRLQFPLLLDSDEANSIHLICDFKCSKPDTIRLTLSAYSMEVMAEGYKPTKCILPYSVETSKYDAKYDANTLVLSVRLRVLSDDGPDVGSHPWMLQRGLSSKDKIPLSRKPKVEPATEVSSTGSSDEDDDVYPEDKFHAQDAFSNYMLKKQQEEMGTS